MGKILMFKDADFSAVAVDQVPTGKTTLNPSIVSGDMSINENGEIITNRSTTGWKIYYVPTVAGRVYDLSIVWRAVHYQRVGLSSSVPALGSVLPTMIVNQQGGAQYATATLDIHYTALSNGYLVWQMYEPDKISCTVDEWQY